MANEEHLKILKQGVRVWNKWRDKNNEIKPDLSGADLSKAILSGVDLSEADLGKAKSFPAILSRANLSKAKFFAADLSGANLIKADFSEANLNGVDLHGADLRGARLIQTHLWGADLRGADLSDAKLIEANLECALLSGAKLCGVDLSDANLTITDLNDANLSGADLRGADLWNSDLTKANLTKANLIRTSLVETKLEGANLSNCRIYGISAWNLKLTGTKQENLVVSQENEPIITVDNLEVAQLIYLLLNNEKIRHVIDTITSKVVLILGRFTKPRKAVLDAIRNELRQRDFLPILFDFDKPANRDIHETVGTLARMARFVIADITNPRCIPQELVSIVEQLPSLPIQPLLKHGSKPWGMYDHIKRYPWVLEIHRYRNLKALQGSLKERVIVPAEEKWLELNQKG